MDDGTQNMKKKDLIFNLLVKSKDPHAQLEKCKIRPLSSNLVVPLHIIMVHTCHKYICVYSLNNTYRVQFSKSTAFYVFFADQFKINYTLKSNCRRRFEFFRNLFVQSQNWQHILLDFREEEKNGKNFNRDESNNFCICNHQYQPQICIRKSVIRSQFCLLHFWKFDVFSIVTTDFCFVSSEEAGKIFDKIEGLSGKISSKKLQHKQAKSTIMGWDQFWRSIEIYSSYASFTRYFFNKVVVYVVRKIL